MPHKHTRRRSTSPTAYDLPPTSLARPLPTFTPQTTKPKPKPKPRVSKPASARPTKTPAHDPKAYPSNDTPRAFTRLMTPRPPPRSGLDDGPSPAHKKRKRDRDAPAPAPPLSSHPQPQILRGETLSSFSARVDAALPVRGLTAKGKRMEGGGRQTKTERRMQRMQREWRVEEERRRGKREELREEEEEESDVGGRGKGGEEEGDLWAGIAAKPLQREGGGLVGLHDVVLAPPKLKKVTREGFRVGGGGKGAGLGLKRQAELGDARRKVVEGYRALMKQRGRDGEVG